MLEIAGSTASVVPARRRARARSSARSPPRRPPRRASPQGTPVVVGGADTQLGLLGIGVTEPGRFTVVGGTFWQHTVVLDEPLIDPRRAPPDALPHRARPLDDGGDRLLLRDRHALVPRRVLRRSRRREAAARRASTPTRHWSGGGRGCRPGSNGVFGIFSNLMQANRWVHASPAFLGFDVGDPARPAAHRVLPRDRGERRLRRARPPRDRRGGRRRRRSTRSCSPAAPRRARCGRRSSPTCSACPVRVPVVKESTALGRRDLRRRRRRAYADAGEAAARAGAVRADASSPSPPRSPPTTELYERWLELYRRSLELSEAGLVRPLWRAAGT